MTWFGRKEPASSTTRERMYKALRRLLAGIADGDLERRARIWSADTLADVGRKRGDLAKIAGVLQQRIAQLREIADDSHRELQRIDRAVHNRPMFAGFDRRIGDEIDGVVQRIGDVRNAIARHEAAFRGYGSNAPAAATLIDDLGKGIARPLSIARGFARKALIALDAWYAEGPRDTSLDGEFAELEREMELFMERSDVSWAR